MHSSWFNLRLEKKRIKKGVLLASIEKWGWGIHMNPQFKKGVLELIVLESVGQKDMYGYELVEEVSQVIDVNEGTIYPLLKRLTNERYFETYLRESSEGPPRKYYHLTAAGILYRDMLAVEWEEFQEKVNAFLKGRKQNGGLL